MALVRSLLATILLLAACAAPDRGPAAPTSTPAASAPEEETRTPTGAGTTVRFRAGATSVDVRVQDTPVGRDFVSMLPLTLEFSDFHGQEKVADPPRPFDYTGAEPMTPRPGDLFSYRPWGNLGFFYETTGLGRSNDLVRIGTTDDLEAVQRLDGERVEITVQPER